MHRELVHRQFAAAVDSEVAVFVIILSVTVLPACIGPFQIDVRTIIGCQRVAESKSKVLVDKYILGHIIVGFHSCKLSPAISKLIFLQAPDRHIKHRAVEIVSGQWTIVVSGGRYHGTGINFLQVVAT